jgi:hypothetical protein
MQQNLLHILKSYLIERSILQQKKKLIQISIGSKVNDGS